MPKVLVLFASNDHDARTVAAAAAEGAKSLRFTEADVRDVASSHAPSDVSTGAKTFDGADSIHDYHGIVLALSGDDLPPAMGALLSQLEQGHAAGSLANKVFGVASSPSAEVLARVVRLGAIVASVPDAGSSADTARALGARVAKVSEWVRHALSHEH